MLEAVLLDIDNTLILFDEQRFIKTYLPEVYRPFNDLMGRDEFIKRIMTATEAVSKNPGILRNDECFLQVFSRNTEWRAADLWSRFESYYSASFNALQHLVVPAPGVQELFSHLRQQNIAIVLASNPLWPENVQLMRCEWAGADAGDIRFVTHIKNMRSCKPFASFFSSICDAISVNPENCLMIGNDEIQDMAAGRVGMKTFQVLDGRKFNDAFFLQAYHDDAEMTIPEADYSGNLFDAVDVITTLHNA